MELYRHQQTPLSNSSPASPTAEFLHWQKQDRLVKCCLSASLSPSIASRTLGCKTSRDLWTKIERHFIQQSTANRSHLRRQLHTLKKGNLSIADYLTSLSNTGEQLAAIGDQVPDEDLVLFALNGLPSDYSAFVTTIENLPEPPTFSDLRAKLLMHEQRILSYHSSVPIASGDVAFVANSVSHGRIDGRGGGRGGGHNSRHGGRRYNGGRYGSQNPNPNQVQPYSQAPPNHQPYPTYTPYNQSMSHYPVQNPPRPNYNKPLQQCQICWKWGHIAATCRFRYSESRNNQPKASFDHNSLHTAFSAMNFQPNHGTSSHIAEWLPDTGASAYMTPNPQLIESVQQYHSPNQVIVGNGNILHISSIGHSTLISHPKALHLHDVLLVPQLTTNLLSVAKFVKDNSCLIEFNPFGYIVKDLKTKIPLLAGDIHNNLYPIKIPRNFTNPVALTATHFSLDLWHQRLGHPCRATLLSLSKFLPNKSNVINPCHSCHQGKSTRLSFSLSSRVSTQPLQIIHCDIWGPSPFLSHSGSRYFIIFIDDYSRYSWIFPLTSRSEALCHFQHFKATTENLFSTTIKMFQCDGAPELIKGVFAEYLNTHGISYRISCPYTPQQNGVAERKIRHITETGLTLLVHASLPKSFWFEAFSTAVYLINLLPTPLLHHKSPYELLFMRKPNLDHLRVFGCTCFPFLGSTRADKLTPKSTPCVFLGYSPVHKGYRCFDPQTHKLYISRHVRFLETSFFYAHPPPLKTLPTNIPLTPSSHVQIPIPFNLPSPTPDPSLPANPAPNDVTTPLPPSPLPPHLPSRHPMITRTRDQSRVSRSFSDYVTYHTTHHSSIPDPTSFTQANKFPHWRQAMLDEFTALHRNQTWTLIPPPPNANIVGCKWVFRTKYKPDGSLDRYKARLVAKGYHQSPGVDYTDTFSPVVKPTTIRLILTLAITHNWPVRQLDVNNAFLHGTLHEPIYMAQPSGFSDPHHPHYVCHLHKALYGLKQAPRAWFHRLSQKLLDLNFTQSKSDTSLFIQSTSTHTTYVLVYVDDILVTGSSQTIISSVINDLNFTFSIKDLGLLHYFLGIEVIPTSDGLLLTQTKYTKDLLTRTHLDSSKSVPTPMTPTLPLSKNHGTPLSDPSEYRSTVGALQYLCLTRPDIQFAVNKVSQFLHCPTDVHWTAVKRILRYLRSTPSHGIHLTKATTLNLNAYCDADWAGCPDDRRSTSGYCMFFGPILVSWSAKKQPTVARSSTEAEYRSIALAAAELCWINSLLGELGLSNIKTTLWCDNLGATFLAADPISHARTKHIEIDIHFVRDLVAKKSLFIHHISSAEQIADVMTKALASTAFHQLRDKLTVVPPMSLRGLITHKEYF